MLKMLVMVVSIVSSAAGLQAAPAPEVPLEIADGFATDHFVRRAFADPLAASISASGAGLTATQPGDRGLGSGRRMLDAVQRREIAVGLLFPDALPNMMPALKLAELPGVAPSTCALAVRLWTLTAPDARVAQTDLTPHGLHRIALVLMPDYQLLLRRGFGWHGLASVKGSKVRTTTQAGDRLIKSLGGNAVRMSAKEMAAALADGRIDGALTTSQTIITQAILPAFQGGTDHLDLGLVVQVYAMSETAWRSLDARQRAALERSGRRSTLSGCRAVDAAMHYADGQARRKGIATLATDEKDRRQLSEHARDLYRRAVLDDFAGRDPLAE